eukprot:gene7741-13574_t
MYGYIAEGQPGTGSLVSADAVTSALKRYQTYAGLKPSGIVDKETVAKFREPRCGMSDQKTLGRKKRYVHQGTKWMKKRLTWKIIRYSSNPSRTLSNGQVRRTVYETLQKWSAVADIDFQETTLSDADILISFRRTTHDDPYPFDGRGGTLAHAYYPSTNQGLAGDAHFDDDEIFTLRTAQGTNFYWVALHEFGHSLGLEHSNHREAIMYPWYQGYKGDDVDLRSDDILGIQTLYGARVRSETTAMPETSLPKTYLPTTQPPFPECFSRIQAAYLGNDELTYVVHEDKLYKLGKYLRLQQGPVPVGSVFSGVTKVDAMIFKKETGEQIFFHGDKYWVFRGSQKLSGPNHISRYGLTNEMSNLDAALSWKGSGKQYFFKGANYWRYDVGRRRVDPGYPKSISAWGGIPSDIDAAMQWRNNAIYFFKGEKFYRFDTRRISLVPGYPKKLMGDFIICPVKGKAGQISGVGMSRDQAGSGGIRLESERLVFIFLAFVTINIVFWN